MQVCAALRLQRSRAGGRGRRRPRRGDQTEVDALATAALAGADLRRGDAENLRRRWRGGTALAVEA